ncbi:MAG: HD domain-containing protein [Planctomycetota bacterium]
MADTLVADGDPTHDQIREQIECFLKEYIPPDMPPYEVGTTKVIHDGLWGTVLLHSWELCFLDTPLFQRLRQIHQTGLAYLVYPSATHSRLEHTLGVMHNVQRLFEAITKAKNQKSLGRPDPYRLAALFHDVGHGIFSHASEQVYGNLTSASVFGTKRPHEALSELILSSNQFQAYAAKVADKHKVRIDVETLGRWIVGSAAKDESERFMREIINGPFDSDKLDYLFRDSHFTGLRLSVDLDRLWYTVRIRKAKGHFRLVVLQSGATPLEQILFSKMMLLITVYHHHKVRACDCMFDGIIEYMHEHNISYEIRGMHLNFRSPVDFLWLTDNDLYSLGFRTPKDEKLHDLIHNLYFRRLLKRAVILSRRMVNEDEGDNDLGPLLEFASPGQRSALKRRQLAREIYDKAKPPDCLPQEVWLDLPEMPSTKAADETYVLPTQHGVPVPLKHFFPAGKWPEQYGITRWRGHVFCPEHCRDKVAKATMEVLREKYSIHLKKDAFLECKVKVPR